MGREVSHSIWRIAVVASALTTTACASLGVSSGGNDHLDRLTFGLGIRDTGFVSDSAWAVFIDEVVTPRFPQGFAVFRTEGQWRLSNGKIVKEPGRILELIHTPDPVTEARVVEIAEYYIRKFEQEAVGRQIIAFRGALITSGGRP